MFKNIIISTLAAVLVAEQTLYFCACTMQEKFGVMIGICVPLIIFCLFCENLLEKWRKYRRRVRKVRRTMKKLQEVRL